MTIQGKTVRPYIPSLVSPECEAADHLGIVMVHGVGFQTRGETLLAWSERLLRMLAAIYGSRDAAPADLVHRSELDLAGDDLSFVEIRIPGVIDGRRPQHWLVTEAFWAASFQPPSVPTMLAWLGARGAAALAARGFPLVKRLRNSVYLSGIVVGLLVVYSGIRVVTSILPIAALRSALVGPLDRLLTGWSGDMHVLLFDPAQSADIRTRVREAMQAVANAGFPRVAVVAHSGGAVASYMTLADGAAWPEPKAGQRKPPQVVSYITLGQGLNIAWRLCGVGDGASCQGAAGSGVRLISNVREHHETLHWHDYYSEGDTVAEAQLALPECLLGQGPEPGNEHPIENKPSNPHGGYWDNDEEFLFPVVETLIAAAKREPAAPPPPNPSPPPDELADEVVVEDADEPQTNRDVRIGMFSFTSRVLFGVMVSTIVASALFGGARMDDFGKWLASTVEFIPASEIVTGPIGWLQGFSRQDDLEWARGIGTFVVVALLLLAALYAVIRLLPRKLAWGNSLGQNLFRLPIVLTDVVAGFLPPGLVVAWWLLKDADRGYAPAPPVVTAIAVLLALLATGFVIFTMQDEDNPQIAHLNWPPWINAGLAAISLIVAGVGIFTAVVAVTANESFKSPPLDGDPELGTLVLGAVVVWLLFRLLGGVANWRWDAWDGREREAFRKRKGVVEARPLWHVEHGGRVFDLAVIVVVAAAAIALALGVGAPFLGAAGARLAFIWASGLILFIFLIGVMQDAYNTRAGAAAQEVSPLPPSG